tara:strand:+ start:31 stop:561 length:531 start_codon:yes stop_codon:yes gene_type:complete
MASKDETIRGINADFINRVANTLNDASSAISEIYARRKMNLQKPPPMQMPMQDQMQQPAMPDMQMSNEMPQSASDPSQAGQQVNDFLNSANMQTSNIPQPESSMPMQSNQMPMQNNQMAQPSDTDQEKMAAVQQFSQQTGQDPTKVIEKIISGNLQYIAGQGVIDQNQMASNAPLM